MATMNSFLYVLMSMIAAEIMPTIKNESGSYFISNGSYLFSNNNILCHSSYINCYIWCSCTICCTNTIIKAETNTSSIVYCNDSYSCSSITIYAQNTDYLAIIPTKWGYFNPVNIMKIYASNTKNLNINCENGHCNGLTLYATNSTETNVSCIGQFYPNHIYDTTCSQFEIICNGPTSCSHINLYAQNAKFVNITALSNVPYAGAITHSTLNIPSDYRTQINCINRGCMSMDLQLMRGINRVNVSYFGNCSKCNYHNNDHEYCGTNWNIFCVPNNKTVVFHAGYGKDVCSNNYTQCCTEEQAKKTYNVFEAY